MVVELQARFRVGSVTFLILSLLFCHVLMSLMCPHTEDHLYSG